MADVRPFRAVRFDPARVGDLAAVVTPPYDVIDEKLQEALYARSEFNFVRVDLARDEAGDDDSNNRYTRAAAKYASWLESGTLRRDEVPSLYVYEQTFEVAPGKSVTRRGFLGVVRLHDYAEGIILPHERTLRGPKEDRLRLMEATQAQLSQLFLLYDDPERAIDRVLAAARAATPLFDATTDDGIHHVLWAVTDEAAIRFVSERLASERLLIADGHHRYETALAFRNARRAGPAAEDRPWDFALAYLANSADPGLTVWPTHRALYGLAGFDADQWVAQATAYFDVTALPATLSPAELEQALATSSIQAPSFIVLLKGGAERLLLRLDASRSEDALARIQGPEASKRLDVAVLHDFVLPALTGVSLEAQAAKTNIHYVKGLEAALEAAVEPEHQLVFLMNPLPVPLVRAVCESGGFMPQKSTFFYPKVLSGLVLNDLTDR